MVRSPPRSTLFPYPTPFRSNTAIDDPAAGRITLASLTRTANENVGAWTILTGTAGGTAIGNYTPTVNTNGHVLNINPVALTVDLSTDASKSYGTNDPSVTATNPTFIGRVVIGRAHV